MPLHAEGMTVKELMAKLAEMPQDLPVLMYYDSGARDSVTDVYVDDETRCGTAVVVAGDS